MNISDLEKWCNCYSVSSYEDEACNIMLDSFKKYKMEIKRDRLGSVFGIIRSKNPKAKTLMIASSLDEVGFMISSINENGSLAFISLETQSLTSMLHQKVVVFTRENKQIVGVITNKKNTLENRCDINNIEELCIDCGFRNKEEASVIIPGDLAGYKSNFYVNDNTVISKGLFPHITNVIVLELLKKIKDNEFDYNIAIGGIVQSVIGFRGTKTSTYVIEPDAAIALTVFDTGNNQVKLNDGLVLGYYDKQMLPSKRFLSDFTNNTKSKSYFGQMGNDGSFIHKTLRGTPTISLGLPINNVGSANEIGSISDIDDIVMKLYSYLRYLNNELISSFGFGDTNV